MSAVGSPTPIDAAPLAPPPRRASELLTLLTSDIPTEQVTIDQIMRALGERGFGLLIIFFSLPCFVPIPGLAEVCGVPILILGAQMAMGRRSPRLPGFIAQRSMKRVTIQKIVSVVNPRLRKVESVLKPRWPMLFTPTMDRLLGVFVLMCAIAIIFPFPGTNAPVAIALIMTSMAVMEEDGVTLSAGLLIGTAGLAYSSVVIIAVSWFTLKMLAKMIVV